MGIVDKAKDTLTGVKEKTASLADEHGDKVTGAVDKATDFVDDKTKGKYTAHLDKVNDVTATAINKLAGRDGGSDAAPTESTDGP